MAEVIVESIVVVSRQVDWWHWCPHLDKYNQHSVERSRMLCANKMQANVIEVTNLTGKGEKIPLIPTEHPRDYNFQGAMLHRSRSTSQMCCLLTSAESIWDPIVFFNG